MRRLFGLAVRNLFRQKRRSALTGTAIALGVGFVMFLAGFFNGFVDTIIRRTVETQVGAIQIHRAGYFDADEPLKFDMPQDKTFIARIKAVPGVVQVAPRLRFEGLLNNGSSASVVLATGFDPALEYEVCPGRTDIEGEGLTAADGDTAILGEELAATLALKPGSEASLLTGTQAGKNNAMTVAVKSTLTSNLPVQAKTVAVVPLKFAQALLQMPGRVTEYAISIRDISRVPEIAAALQRELGPDYLVETWRQRDAMAATALDQIGIVLAVIISVLFLLVASGVVNTMLMSVSERVREIGTMLALGVKRRQVMGIFVSETLVLSLVAAILGAALGFLAVKLVAIDGVAFTAPDIKPLVIRPIATLAGALWTMLGTTVGALVSAIYPALRASRLSPVEALRAV